MLNLNMFSLRNHLTTITNWITGTPAVRICDFTGQMAQLSLNSLHVVQTNPPSQRTGNQLICTGTGLTVNANGGTANSYAVDIRYFTRKTALLEITGAPITCTLKVSYCTDQSNQAYSPYPTENSTWQLAEGKHALIIPEGLQADYAWFNFVNNDSINIATIKGFWQLKEV